MNDQTAYTVYREFSHQEILAKMMLGRCVKFSLSPIFAISWTLNENIGGFIFGCLFLAISGRSQTQRKSNPCEKFPIYGRQS